MSALNWHQKYLTNPVTTNQSGDLGYWARSPYGAGNDAVISWDDFVRQFQQLSSNVASDVGALNAYVGVYAPVISAYTPGLILSLNTIGFTNTGAATFDGGAGAVPIITPDGNLLVGGEIPATSSAFLFYNLSANAFELINSALIGGGGVTATQVQQSAFNIGVDSGVADAYVVALSPVISVLTDGLTVEFTPLNSSLTTAPTVDVGTGALSIFGRDYSALKVGDFVGGIPASITYNFSDGSWQLNNPQSAPSGVTPDQVQQQSFTYAPDTGATNAIAVALVPTILSNGTILGSFMAANNNTGATTIDFGFGALDLVTNPNNVCVGGEILAGGLYQAMFNVTNNNYVLLNSSLSSGGGVTALQVQHSDFNIGIDSGTDSAYILTMSPTLLSLTDNLIIQFTPSNNNTLTTTPTVTIDGTATTGITGTYGNNLQFNDLVATVPALIMYSSSRNLFQLLNPQGTPVFPKNIQNQTFTFGTDTGTADNYVVAYTPAPVSLQIGQKFSFVAANNNTGASASIDVGVAPPRSIYQNTPGNINPGVDDIVGGAYTELEWTGTYFALLNPLSVLNSGITALSIQQLAFNAGPDIGSLNTYVTYLTPTLVTLSDGMPITLLRVAVTNTGASTLDGGNGAKPIVSLARTALVGGEMVANSDYNFMYEDDNGWYVLLNSSLGGGGGAFLPLAGGTMSGDITFSGTNYLDNLTGFKDSSGNIGAAFNYIASAVNYFTFYNNATGDWPLLAATGSDPAVGIVLEVKNAYVGITDSTGTQAGAIGFSNKTDTHTIILTAPATQATDLTYVLPGSDGVADAPMTTDGSGNLLFGGTWTDISGTVTINGFSVITVGVVRQCKIGNIVHIHLVISGTSNSTSFTITGLPYASFVYFTTPALTTNAGTNSISLVGMSASGTTITIWATPLSNTFVNTGAKGTEVNFFYETS